MYGWYDCKLGFVRKLRYSGTQADGVGTQADGTHAREREETGESLRTSECFRLEVIHVIFLHISLARTHPMFLPNCRMARSLLRKGEQELVTTKNIYTGWTYYIWRLSFRGFIFP